MCAAHFLLMVSAAFGALVEADQSASEHAGDLRTAVVEKIPNFEPKPISQVPKCKNVPMFLRGAQIYVPKGGRNHPGAVRFTVAEDGLLLLAASWDAAGRQRTTKPPKTSAVDLMSDEWTLVGTMVYVTQRVWGQVDDEHFLFRKRVKAGQEYDLRTRNSFSPLVVLVDPERAAEVAALPAIRYVPRDIRELTFDRADPRPTSPPTRVSISTHEPPEPRAAGRYRARFGLLLREYVRQGLFLAARDQLGLEVVDESLGDTPGEGVLHLHVAVTSLDDAPRSWMGITVFVVEEDGPHVVWEYQGKCGGRVNSFYQSAVETVEELSRTGFVQALKQAGCQGQPRPSVPDGNVPNSVTENLATLNAISQYAAVRQLHTLIDESGASPERVAALARGYAALGSLTERFWSRMSKAFKARALLYARRLCVETDDSFPAVWTEAYVQTLCGRHSQAGQRIEQALQRLEAAKLDAASPPPEVPEWVPLLKAFVTYDSGALKTFREEGPNKALARYLWLLSLEHHGGPNVTAKAVQSLLEEVPECFRAVDTLATTSSLGLSRAAVQQGESFFSQTVYDRVRSVRGLPQDVRDLLDGPQAAVDEVQHRARLLAAFRAAAKHDNVEPSLQVLAQLIREASFLQTLRSVEFRGRKLAVSSDDVIERARPMLQGHPFHWYLESLSWSTQEAEEALEEFEKTVPLDDLEYLHGRAFLKLLNQDEEKYSPLAKRLEERRDDVYYDFAVRTDYAFLDGYTQSHFYHKLEEVAKELPLSPFARLTYGETYNAEELEEKYADSGTVQYGLGRWYQNRKKTEEAVRCYRRAIEVAPDRRHFLALAGLYKQNGDDFGWRETLQAFLETPVHGLDHARVRVQLARHYMEREQYDRAVPLADEAAATGAEWALRCAAECHESLENWEQAEKNLRAISMRYRGSKLAWFRFCYRTGHGNVEQATEFTREHFLSLGETLTTRQYRDLATFSVLAEEPQEALTALKEAFEQEKDSFDGVLAALLAHQIEDAKARRELIEAVAARSGLFGDAERLQIARLGRLFRDAWQGRRTLDLRDVEDLIKAAPRGDVTKLYFLVGWFLHQQDKAEDGDRYLKLCATSPLSDDTVLLARAELRRRKIEIGETRKTERPEEDEEGND